MVRQLIAEVKKIRLERLGHEIRMDNGTVTKKLIGNKLDWGRKFGIPGLIWLEHLEKNIRVTNIKREIEGRGDRGMD